MKDFIRPRGRLRTLPLPARVVYSVFAAFTLVALAFTAWLAEDMLGADLHELDAYYAGKPSGGGDAPALRGGASSDHDVHATSGNGGQGGPVLELPPEADAPSASPPMPLRKLLEVTHFHLFSMPVYLLILSHLFMLSRMGERAKLFWIALGTASVAAHMAAPWLARSGGAGAKAAYGGSGTAMMVSLLVMTLVPLWEMWSPIPGGERNAGSGATSSD